MHALNEWILGLEVHQVEPLEGLAHVLLFVFGPEFPIPYVHVWLCWLYAFTVSSVLYVTYYTCLLSRFFGWWQIDQTV